MRIAEGGRTSEVTPKRYARRDPVGEPILASVCQATVVRGVWLVPVERYAMGETRVSY
jgi:hypothetical protein